jgi:hypothetical protein
LNNGLRSQRLYYDDIRKHADAFLEQHHPSRSIPIPIEKIIEFQLGIDIVPVPGLLSRYRFTLAHEVGHIVLHQHIYSEAKFKNSQEWKSFINSIPDKTHSWLEYQAYAFGGLILVPVEHLNELTCKYVKLIDEEGISLRDNWDYAWDCIAYQIAKDFKVSASVIEKRLQKEEIKERYR